MLSREIAKNIHSVGALDFERRLFDELIPLPDGTTYNSYLVKGSDKIALIDTVDPTKTRVLLDNLKALGVEGIDYVIAQHAEQDHSGSLPEVLKHYPTAKIVTNPKGKEMLKELLPITDDSFITVNDGDTLSLGGRTLKFIYTPWVHWPETLCAYLPEEEILFSCDFFGSHLAGSDLYAVDEPRVYRSAKRYYAEIMMPFRTSIKSNLEKIKGLKIKLIAPSHGPVYQRPDFILNAYRDWIGDEVKNEVVIPYVSMHGSTAVMVNTLVEALEKKGLVVKPFNLAKLDSGELAMSLVDAATVVIGTPTVLVGPHPAAVYAAYLANTLRPKTRYAAIIGSFGWGGKMPEQLLGLISNLKVELLGQVIAKGYPKESDLKAIDELAALIVSKHQADSLVIK